MTAEIIDLQQHQPHLVISGEEGVHVVPRSVFIDIIRGNLDYREIEGFDDVIKTILREWLEGLDD